MDYNTTRSHLTLPEYGRSVQNMVEQLLAIEDKAKRTEQAKAVIEVMAILNPQLKGTEDYYHKLWDHLYQISDFKLDVESPYPVPSKEQLMAKPEPLPYPQDPNNIRHFGRNLELLINKAIAEPDEQKRQGFTQIIGYYMKLAYTNWHREPVHDDMIRNELSQLSKGQLLYEPGGYKVYFDTRSQAGGNYGKNRNRNYKGGNNNNNNNNNNNGGNRNFKNKNYKNRNYKNNLK